MNGDFERCRRSVFDFEGGVVYVGVERKYLIFFLWMDEDVLKVLESTDKRVYCHVGMKKKIDYFLHVWSVYWLENLTFCYRIVNLIDRLRFNNRS